MKVLLLVLTALSTYLRRPIVVDSRRKLFADLAADHSQIELPVVRRHEADFIALISMMLATGLTLEQTLEFTSRYGPSTLRGAISRVLLMLSNGHSLPEALSSLRDSHARLQLPIQVLITSHSTGSQCADALDLISKTMYEQHHSEKLKSLRSLSVRTVLPLGLCFLPAFILLAVVPLSASLLTSL